MKYFFQENNSFYVALILYGYIFINKLCKIKTLCQKTIKKNKYPTFCPNSRLCERTSFLTSHFFFPFLLLFFFFFPPFFFLFLFFVPSKKFLVFLTEKLIPSPHPLHSHVIEVGSETISINKSFIIQLEY